MLQSIDSFMDYDIIAAVGKIGSIEDWQRSTSKEAFQMGNLSESFTKKVFSLKKGEKYL